MPDQQTKELVDRYMKLDDAQANWRVLWQDLADYILPRKSNILNVRTPGTKQTEKLFDSTAINANEQLAASMCSYLTPSNGRWHYIKTRNQRLNENKQVANWLEEANSRLELARRQSNFNAEVHEGFLDVGAFGTKALYLEEAKLVPGYFTGFIYKTFSIGEYVVIEDIAGRVNGIMRKFQLSALEASKKWEKTIPDKIKKEVEKDPDKKFNFLWACIPKDQWKDKGIHPFSSIYVALDDKELLSEGGYYEFPVFVFRWGKTSSEEYGRGPGHTALPDIKTLNKLIEYHLRAVALNVFPPSVTTDKGVLGSIRLKPAGVTVIPKGATLEPFKLGTNFKVTDLEIKELQAAIRRMFFSDQLQLQESPQMTAAEVYVRYELMQRILGPTLGRSENELLNPLIEHEFGIMYRAGALPPMPDVLARYFKGRKIDIEYEGPLARAQRLGEVESLRKFFGFVGPMAEAKPEILDNVDLDETTREVGEAVGVPSKLLRSEEQVEGIRKQRAQIQAAEQKKLDLERMAEGAGKAAPALKAVKELMPEAEGGA